MNRLSKLLSPALLGVLLLALPAAADGKNPPAPTKPDVSVCAKVEASARAQGYGYTHFVTLTNRCDKPVVCEVWTDVDPSPQYTLRAAPGHSDEVITRKGSPAREVRAESRCNIE